MPMPTPTRDLHDSGVGRPDARVGTAESARSLRSTRRMLKMGVLLAACAIVVGVFASRRVAEAGAIVFAAAGALLILTRIERAHRSVVRMMRGRPASTDQETSMAWRAGARAAVRISIAIGVTAIAIGAVLLGEVGGIAAIAAIGCGIAIFGGATWLAVVGEEEAIARKEIDESHAPRG